MTEALELDDAARDWLAANPPPAFDGSLALPQAASRGRIGYVHSYGSSEFNKCGQAAMATVLDFLRVQENRVPAREYDANDRRNHWAAADIIKFLCDLGYGPDVPFGYGTSGGRIADAFRAYGLKPQVGYSGTASAGWESLWKTLQSWVHSGYVVPVLVDVGALGGQWGTGHWPVVYAIENDTVYLANSDTPEVARDRFLDAWWCKLYPYGYNHCMVLCQR